MTRQYQNIVYDAQPPIAVITLNRPPVLNAMNLALLREMRVGIDEARRDPAIRVIVLTGAGEKSFSVGADISMFSEWSKGQHPEFEERNLLEFFHRELGEFIMDIEKPVIAAVNGFALGGGWELVQFCDIILASEDAKFGQPEINLGVIPGIGSAMLPRHIPLNRAKELCFTGEMIDAREAERLGFVNKVVPAHKLMEETYALARKLASKSTVALRLCKAALNRSASELDIESALAYTKECCSLSFATSDAKEGFSAFLEKRKPNFTVEFPKPV